MLNAYKYWQRLTMAIFMLIAYINSYSLTVGIFMSNIYKYLGSFIFTLIMLNAQQKEQMSVPVNKVPSVIQCCDVMLCAAVSIRSVVWCIKCGTAGRSYSLQLYGCERCLNDSEWSHSFRYGWGRGVTKPFVGFSCSSLWHLFAKAVQQASVAWKPSQWLSHFYRNTIHSAVF